MGRRSLLSVALTASLAVVGAGMALAAPTELPAGCTQAEQTVTCTYASTGAEQTFVVPAGITSVRVAAVGGAGGDGFRGLETFRGGVGGRGASAAGVLSGLTPGSTLYVQVGGSGQSPSASGRGAAGGFNGGGSGGEIYGGGGGGASDVRTASRSAGDSLSSRLLVAAGGGGGGSDNVEPGTGDGGDARAAGMTSYRGELPNGGGAATSSAGGAGGVDYSSGGDPGRAGAGGDGHRTVNGGGGGGGAGLFGGGGGGGEYSFRSGTGGGGGGGSSLVPSGGTVGLSSAPASVTISYSVPAATAVAVRGGGTLTVGAQRYSVAVDARVTATGAASGRFALSGGGADTTAGSRTITEVRRTATGSIVTGTAVTASGTQVPFTLTVVDRPGGRDQVTVQIGGRTVSGTLTNGDITTN